MYISIRTSNRGPGASSIYRFVDVVKKKQLKRREPSPLTTCQTWRQYFNNYRYLISVMEVQTLLRKLRKII